MIQLVNSIVCDTVSLSEHGKYDCRGIYPRGILFVADFLRPIHVSFYVEIESEHVGPVAMQFQIEDRALGRVYHNLSVTLDLKGRQSDPIYGGPYPIHAFGPSAVVFSAIAGGQRVDLAWMYFNRLTEPSALPQPSGLFPPGVPPTY